ncbi:MAG: DUF2799 domain-containing protein, partial [Proteobacteria bacterium]
MAAVVMLNACGTMSKSLCDRASWNSVGYQDGAVGRDRFYVREHQKTCGQLVDAEAFEKGRTAGLRAYCSPANAFSDGASGVSYKGTCPPELEATFYKHYYAGQKTYPLVFEREAARATLAGEQEKIENDNSVVGDISKGVAIITGKSQTEAEERRVEDLDDKIHKEFLSAPAGSEMPTAEKFRQNYADTPVSGFSEKSFPVFGVAAGSIIGFGVGHAVTGLYSTRGWKWTAIDAATIAGFFAIGPSCLDKTRSDDSLGVKTVGYETKNSGSCQLGVLALFSGF